LRHKLYFLLFIVFISFQSRGQEIVEIPVSGEWENGGTLYENEELIVEIDFKLSQLACDKSEFGISNHLYRYRITSKKQFKSIEDKFLSFVLIFQDCQGVAICKTVNINIGIKRKSDVWDGIQPLSDPNGDNSFRGMKLLVPFSEVKISKQRNAAKDGECNAKVAALLEKLREAEKKALKTEEKEEVENPMISNSQYYPEIKIVKDAKMRVEPDVFSSAIGTLTTSKKVSIIGQQDAFWKIKFKDREGYILIADQNIDEKEARIKLNVAIAKEQSELNKASTSTLSETQTSPLPTSSVKLPLRDDTKANAVAPVPTEKPVAVKLKEDEVILLKDIGFKIAINQTKKPINLVKGDIIQVIGYESNHWQVQYQGKVGFVLDESQLFELNRTLSRFREQYFLKVKQREADQQQQQALKIENSKPNLIVLDRDAKFRKSPEYSAESKTIAAFETIQIDGFFNRYWKVSYQGEIGYLADDMLYFKETEYLLNLKANPLKQIAKEEVLVDMLVPIYPGGDVELAKDIIAKMKYVFKPRSGKSLAMTYELTVDELGRVESVFIENSISSAIDEEVSKAVKLIKAFKPARKKGLPVISKLKVVLEFR
jgi:hypothetical protein